MAYLAATALNEYRAQYALQNLDKFENRGSGYGLLAFAKRDTPNLISPAEILKAKGTAARLLKIPVLQKITFTPGSVRTCTGQTQATTSALVTLSWATLFNGFSMIPSQYENNEIAYVTDFKHKLNMLEMSWIKAIEVAINTKLDTDKSTTFTADGKPFNFVGNTIQIPEPSQKTYLDQLYASMQMDDFAGPYNIIGSPGVRPLNNYLANQGSGNNANTAYQFGEYNFDYSNRVVVTAGMAGTFFIMPVGSLAILFWIDPDSRAKRKISEGNYWDTFRFPILGEDVGLHYQMACADNTTEGGAGLEASAVETFNFSLDYAIVDPYISSGAYPILKGDLALI